MTGIGIDWRPGRPSARCGPRRLPFVTSFGGRGGQSGIAAPSIKYVIYIQFDNVHYTRDNPNVPSDLEQMPNLLNFITGNGTLVTHEHTPPSPPGKRGSGSPEEHEGAVV